MEEDNPKDKGFFINEPIATRIIGLYKNCKKNNSNVEILLYSISYSLITNKYIDNINELLKDDLLKGIYIDFWTIFYIKNKKHIERNKTNIENFWNSKSIDEKKKNTIIDNSLSRIKGLSSAKINYIFVDCIIEQITSNENKSDVCDFFLIVYYYVNNVGVDYNLYSKISYVFFLAIRDKIDTMIINYNKKIEKTKSKKDKK